MKLWEAISLGLGEIQFTNALWMSRQDDGTCKGCLLGAALFAMGASGVKHSQYGLDAATDTLAEYWPWIAGWRFEGRLPIGDGVSYEPSRDIATMSFVLTHLACKFQAGVMTAEQIVDFIKGLEPQETAAPLNVQLVETETVKVPA